MDTSIVRDGVYRTVRRKGKGRHGCYGEFVANSTALRAEMPELAESVTELRVSEENCGGDMLILRIQGELEVATVLSFRDAVFTAIGRRPQALLLDLRLLGQIDINGMSTLVTVCRVAALMKMKCFIMPSPSLRATMEQTGLCRQSIISEEPSYGSARNSTPVPPDKRSVAFS